MSKVCLENIEKIQSNILRILYDEAPVSVSANRISEIEIRDKQFILRLLKDLEGKKLVKNVTKHFSRKSFWIMTDKAYKKYDELL
tara:strand:+ start:690 stop:944 length:255 start_codon:yes stop_codon:yes gene_type:complete